MRAMVAVEHPGGGVEVIVLELLTDYRWDRTNRGLWQNLPYPVETTIQVSGFGETHRYRERPEWFPAPAEPVTGTKEIEQ